MSEKPRVGSRWVSKEMLAVYVVDGWTVGYGGMVEAHDERTLKAVLLRPEDFGRRLRGATTPPQHKEVEGA